MSGKEQQHKATANPVGTLAKTITDVLATVGFMPSPTEIRNKSNRSIVLIPISCARNANNPLSTGRIEERLARVIGKNSTERVRWWQYSPSCKGYPSMTKILFRDGGENVNLQEFLGNLRASSGEAIKLSEGETLHDHTILCQNSVLEFKPKEDVVIVVKKADQDGKTTQNERAKKTSESSDNKTPGKSLSELTEEVQELKEEIEALKFHMATLVEFLQNL